MPMMPMHKKQFLLTILLLGSRQTIGGGVLPSSDAPQLSETPPAVQLDLSGRVNVHLVGPFVAGGQQQEQQPIFEHDASSSSSVYLGAQYDFRRRWWGVTHILPLLRLRRNRLQLDIAREQSVLPRQFTSATYAKLSRKGCALQWKGYEGSTRKTTTFLLSIPLVSPRIRYECQWGTPQSRRRNAKATGWDVRVNTQGQLEATHEVQVLSNLRVTARICRSWLSDDAVTKAVVKVQTMGDHDNTRTGVTVSFADWGSPLDSWKMSIRQDIAVGKGVHMN